MSETIIQQDAFVQAATFDQRCVTKDTINGGWTGRNAGGIAKQFPDYFAACTYAGLKPLIGADKDGLVADASASRLEARFSAAENFSAVPYIPGANDG